MKVGNMKIKSVLLSVCLGFFVILTSFTLAGCSGKISTLQKSVDAMNAKYESFSTVFKKETVKSYECELSEVWKISYGNEVDGWVEDGKEYFSELETDYNAMFAISAEYVEKNMEYVLKANQKDLSSKSKKILSELNDSVKDFTKEMTSFCKEVRKVDNYFSVSGLDTSNTAYIAVLSQLKEEYGDLIEDNMEISSNLAKMLESMGVFDTLKETATTGNGANVKVLYDYIYVKSLPIFHELMIDGFEDEYWNSYAKENPSDRIAMILDSVKDSFSTYIKNCVNGRNSVGDMNAETLETVISMTNDFFDETENYYMAISDFDFSEFKDKIVEKFGKYTLQDYTSENEFAERDITKIEQYVNITLPNFINKTTNYFELS